MSNAATSHAINEIAMPSKIGSRITPDKKCPALGKNSEVIRAGIAYQRMQPAMLLAGQTATKKLNERKEDKAMKTTSNPIKSSLVACAAFAMVLTINAAEQMKPMKGAE